jgi:hypothetical protein
VHGDCNAAAGSAVNAQLAKPESGACASGALDEVEPHAATTTKGESAKPKANKDRSYMSRLRSEKRPQMQ